MKKLLAAIMAVYATMMAATPAEARVQPPLYVIQSKVTIVYKLSAAGIVPVRFNYILSHLGIVQAQGSQPLTVSHHSLIAAGGIYDAAQATVCNTVTSMFPAGVQMQVYRQNFYHNPPNAPQPANQIISNC